MSYADHLKREYVAGRMDVDQYEAALDRLLKMDPTALEEQGYDPAIDWLGRYQEMVQRGALSSAQAERRAIRQHVAKQWAASDSAARTH